MVLKIPCRRGRRGHGIWCRMRPAPANTAWKPRPPKHSSAHACKRHHQQPMPDHSQHITALHLFHHGGRSGWQRRGPAIGPPPRQNAPPHILQRAGRPAGLQRQLTPPPSGMPTERHVAKPRGLYATRIVICIPPTNTGSLPCRHSATFAATFVRGKTTGPAPPLRVTKQLDPVEFV